MNHCMNLPRPPSHRGAHGFSLIEVLCALLIFAIGVLGLVKLQAVSVQQASGARYRAIAAAQAASLVGRLWITDRAAATLQAQFGSETGGVGYTSWRASVEASGLPNVAGKAPTVSFTTVPAGSAATASSLATVTIFWKAPGDSGYHSHVVLAQVK
ncbi:type IV pilus assembly protein PilV [Rhizobacter sp. OV335]|nr:type IV pilus assembly protein PilV [Rhizobacter sp. OV335]